MQAIKCELCGSNQLIKKDGYFQCEHCGTKYTLEEAKKLIVSGTVEVVKGNAEKERLLSNAKKHVELGSFHTARDIYKTIICDYPDDPIAYFELARIPLLEIVRTNVFPRFYQVASLVKNENLYTARSFDPNFNLDKEWDEVVKKHGNHIIITNEKIIDFDIDLMCTDSSKLNEQLIKLRNTITQDYCQRLYEGNIYIFGHASFYSKMFNYILKKVENIKNEDIEYSKYGYFEDGYVEYLPYDNDLLRKVFFEGTKIARIITKSTEISEINKRLFFSSFLGEKHKLSKGVSFVYGNSVIASDYDGDTYPTTINPNFILTESNIERVLRNYNLRILTEQEKEQIISEIQNELNREKNKIGLIEYIDNTFKIEPLLNEKPYLSELKYRYDGRTNIISFDVFYDYKYGTRKKMGGIYYHETPYDLLNLIKQYRNMTNSNNCPFCNVPFKGFFSPKCPKCGKPKDY